MANNPLFGALNGNQGNSMMQMLQAFNNFRQTFQGDPQEEVMKLVKSGKISQQELDRLQQMASQFMGMFK